MYEEATEVNLCCTMLKPFGDYSVERYIANGLACLLTYSLWHYESGPITFTIRSDKRVRVCDQ